jgi:hypothetical protein
MDGVTWGEAAVLLLPLVAVAALVRAFWKIVRE